MANTLLRLRKAADPGVGLNIWTAAMLMFVAAVLGDSANYLIGRFSGEQLLRRFPRIIKPQHSALTNEFFEKYGGKTSATMIIGSPLASRMILRS
jgi:membrane protein DedA with SNARE-associated domain